MPLYEFGCPNGCREEHFLTLFQRNCWTTHLCRKHERLMEQIISAPTMVKVAPDICYDSPVDGRPITSWEAREEDLKRNHCRPYDPMMKQDAERFRNESQAKVEAAMDETVAEAITKMPTKERGKLYADLTEKGLTADIIRTTV